MGQRVSVGLEFVLRRCPMGSEQAFGPKMPKGIFSSLLEGLFAAPHTEANVTPKHKRRFPPERRRHDQ